VNSSSFVIINIFSTSKTGISSQMKYFTSFSIEGD